MHSFIEKIILIKKVLIYLSIIQIKKISLEKKYENEKIDLIFIILLY